MQGPNIWVIVEEYPAVGRSDAWVFQWSFIDVECRQELGKDLTDLGATYNTIIFIDGVECGHGLIPMPYTHVGGPDNPGSAHSTVSSWMISAYRYSSYGNFYGAFIAADRRFPGGIDDVRVYDRTLSPSAVNWLVTNSGQ